MNNYKPFRFLLLALFMVMNFTVINAVAQDGEKMRDKIEQLKKVKLIEILDLDEEAAEKFFARYNVYENKVNAAFKEVQQAVAELNARIDRKASDADIKAQNDIVLQKQNALHAQVDEKLKAMRPLLTEEQYASEFRYRQPVIYPDDILIAISQSGETADTLAAIREAKLKGATVIGLVNVVGSTIARETDAGVYIHAGPEIGVASTKAFTSQLAVFSLLALYIGRMRNLSIAEGKKIAEAIDAIPEKIKFILDHQDTIKEIAKEFANVSNCLYLGRGYNFPAALEGALKLKEISYIHAEGYPAAEMKHGPIALIDENMPVVFIAPKDELYDKVLSNIQEVKARKGKIIAIASEGDTHITDFADHVIYIPNTLPMLVPVLASIPLQLLAYYIAVERGCNVDMPRNLAKSVTVE